MKRGCKESGVPPQLCYTLACRYQLKRMSFLAPWVSELGGWVCDASVAVLPTRAGAVVCATGTSQLGVTVIALCGGVLAWWETRRRLRRHG